MDFIKKPAAHIFLLVLLGVLTYSGTFHVPFVFDDVYSISDNPIIKDLANFISRPDGYAAYSNRYIGYLTFALNYRLGGLDVRGYHIVNLAIHLINALLVYLLVILTFKTDRLKNSSIAGSAGFIALFAAALFVAHPVETQAVTYIVQRLASLAALFYLAALVFFIKARAALGREKTGRLAVVFFYFLSLLSAALAMKTKEIALTLPLIVLLYELFFLEGRVKKRLLFLLPMLITFLIIPLSMISIREPAGLLLSAINKASTNSNLPRLDYLFTQFNVVVTYLRLIFLPVNQQFDYDYPISHSLFEPHTLGSLILLMCLFGAAILIFMRSRKGGDGALRLVSFGILWFFITLSVESSVIPIKDVIFEHRVYLPSVGIFMALASAGAMVARKWSITKSLPLVAASLAVFALSVAAYERNTAWASRISLWQDNVNKSPFKARPHVSLGVEYFANGRVDLAIEEFQTVVKLKPGDAKAHVNLGAAYNAKGWVDRAIEEYRAALMLKPGYANAHNNLGAAYNAKGWVDMAIEEYQAGLSLQPDNAEIHYNLGVAYNAKGWADRAIEEYRVALMLKPDYADASRNLKAVLLNQGSSHQTDKEHH
jgi:Flp pilus assembly protein TadD